MTTDRGIGAPGSCGGAFDMSSVWSAGVLRLVSKHPRMLRPGVP